MITTRWYCEECDDVCEKRPFFNVYLPGRKNASGPDSIGQLGAEWLCVNCKHIPSKHSFTFKKPKEKEDDQRRVISRSN